MPDHSYRRGTIRAVIAEEILSQYRTLGDRDAALAAAEKTLLPMVGQELVFTQNPPRGQRGRRQALPVSVQRERFPITFENVVKALNGSLGPVGPQAPVVAEIKPEPAPVPKGNAKLQEEAEGLLRWIQSDLRPIAHRKGPDGSQLDEIGLRPAENAARMLTAGIPAQAIKHALTLSYPSEARRALGVMEFDPSDFKSRKWTGVVAPDGALDHSGEHRSMPYCVALATARVPIALVGPKGTGKTTLARQLATRLGIGFGMASMTGGTPPGEFKGRPKVGGDGGFVRSQFERVYTEGGVYLFDEMDAADENLLLLVNAALANGSFVNGNAEIVKRHPDFIPVCGMNTMGLGQDRNYNGRTKLDAATLDRWNAGRVMVNLDPALEAKIFWTVATGVKS